MTSPISGQLQACRGRGIDSRAVLLSSLAGILAVKGREDLLGLSLAGLVMATAVVGLGIPWRGFLRRCLWVLPFCLCALPLLFTLPGPSVEIAGTGWRLSQDGLQRFGVIVAQTLLCLQVIIVGSAVSGPYGMVEALGRLGCPTPLVAILKLCLRYLDLLQDELGRMVRAREVRGGGKSSLALRARTTGQMAGTLMLRSLHRAERVEMAMRCRGGLLPPQAPGRWGGLEWSVVALAFALVGVSWTL